MIDPNAKENVEATEKLIAAAIKANPAKPRLKDADVLVKEVAPTSVVEKARKKTGGRKSSGVKSHIFSVRVPDSLHQNIIDVVDKEYIESSVRQSINDFVKVAIERELIFRKRGKRLSDDERFESIDKSLDMINESLNDIIDLNHRSKNSELINNYLILKLSERFGIKFN
jgi:hypothetical protein